MTKKTLLRAAAAVFLLGTAPAAYAQTLTTQKEFNIPAQSLESALIDFSKESGIQIIAASDLVSGKRTKGLKETGAVEKCLADLLDGTGLTYRSAGAATVTIVPLGGSGDVGGGGQATSPRAPARRAADNSAAPQTGETSFHGVETVMVTAERRAMPIAETPIAVTSFRGSDMEKNGQYDLTDVIGQAPGVAVRPSENGIASVSIRGMSAPIGDATVGYYVDEIPFSLPGSTVIPNMRSFDLGSIEVLRGPQGTLYGQGSMGGTVRLLTMQPDLENFDAKADLSAGAKKGGDGDYIANAEVNFPLLDDELGLRVVGGYQRIGGFIHDLTSGKDDINDSRDMDFRTNLLFQPTEDLSISLMAWIEQDTTHFSLASFADHTYVGGPGPGPDTLHVNTKAYNATIRYQFSFAELTSSTSYMLFGIGSNNTSQFLTPATTTTVSVLSNERSGVFSQEERLVSSGDGPFKWVIGDLYSSVNTPALANVDVNTVVPVPGVIVGTLTDVNGVIQERTNSVYGQASVLLFDGLVEPLLGLRYFTESLGGHATTTVTNTLVFTVFPIPPSSTTTTTVQAGPPAHYSSFDPRFNIAFHLNKDWLLYTNVAEGFRGGQGNGPAAVAVAAGLGITGIEVVKPDTVWSYEVGSKTTLLDGRLALEGALYYNSWKNVQLLPTEPITQTSFIINAGNAHTEGVEFNANYQPLDGLMLQLSGSLNQSRLDTINPLISGFLAYAVGQPLDYSPKAQLNGTASYTWDLGIGDDWQGYVYANVNYNSRMASHNTVFGLVYGQDIVLANFRAGIERDKWAAYLFVDNAFNENAIYTNLGGGLGERPQPRVIGINLKAEMN